MPPKTSKTCHFTNLDKIRQELVQLNEYRENEKNIPQERKDLIDKYTIIKNKLRNVVFNTEQKIREVEDEIDELLGYD